MRVPPVIGDRWQVWAEELRRYLGRALSQLVAKDAAAKASEDGVILWDRVNGHPVVSRTGAFLALPVMAAAPVSAAASGTAGDLAYDASYIYVCVATNTWKRVAIATW